MVNLNWQRKNGRVYQGSGSLVKIADQINQGKEAGKWV